MIKRVAARCHAMSCNPISHEMHLPCHVMPYPILVIRHLHSIGAVPYMYPMYPILSRSFLPFCPSKPPASGRRADVSVAAAVERGSRPRTRLISAADKGGVFHAHWD